MDKTNLLNIVQAANQEDAAEVMNQFEKEVATRIHNNLEDRKKELANNLVNAVELEESSKLKRKLNEYGLEGYGSYEDTSDTGEESGESFKFMRDNELRMKYGIEQGENIDLEFIQAVERIVGSEIATKLASLSKSLREKFFQIFIAEIGQEKWDDAYGMLGMLDANDAKDALEVACKKLKLTI